MKTLILIAILACASAVHADLPDFHAWAIAERSLPADAELKKEAAVAVFEWVNEELPNGPDGKPIAKERVTMLSPAGLRYLADSGTGFVPFSKLPNRIKVITGWTESVEKLYTVLKKEEGRIGNAAALEAYKDGIKKENELSARSAADAEKTSIPRMPATVSIGSARKVPTPYSSGALARNGRFGSGADLAMSYEQSSSLRKRAAEKYPDNYSMQEYEIKQQTKAFPKLQKLEANGYAGVPGDVFDRIVTKAKAKWDEDYDMRLYTIIEECDAYLKVNP